LSLIFDDQEESFSLLDHAKLTSRDVLYRLKTLFEIDYLGLQDSVSPTTAVVFGGAQ
jgi:hypothetical protein